MYEYINLEDELRGIHDEVEFIAAKEISYNGETFMSIDVVYNKTEKYYEMSHQYHSTSNIRLNTSSNICRLFYKTYKDKESIMDVFNNFEVAEEDVEIMTTSIEDL